MRSSLLCATPVLCEIEPMPVSGGQALTESTLPNMWVLCNTGSVSRVLQAEASSSYSVLLQQGLLQKKVIDVPRRRPFAAAPNRAEITPTGAP